jgi:hypothetical protein
MPRFGHRESRRRKRAHRSRRSCRHTRTANQLFVGAGRLHQRKQFIDCLFGNVAHAIGIERSGDSHLTDHGEDFVAEVAQKPQRVLGIVRNARDQTGNENLTRDHSAIEFFHAALLLPLPRSRLVTQQGARPNFRADGAAMK